MTTKNKILLKIKWTIFFFLFLFAPPIIPGVHTYFMVAIVAIGMILFKYGRKYKNILHMSGLYQWIVKMMIFFVYVYAVYAINLIFLQEEVQTSHYITLFNRFFGLIISIVPVVCFVLLEFENYNLNFIYMIENIISAAMVESVFAISSFFSPALKSKLVAIMNRNTGSTLYQNSWYITVRSYGFADSLVDVFGMGVAIIAGLSFFYGVLYKKRYIAYSFVVIISAVLNSRTGLLIYLMSLVLCIIYIMVKGRVKIVLPVMLGLGILVILSYWGLGILSQNEATSGWVQSGIDSVNMYIKTGSSQKDAMSVIASNTFWELPPFGQCIFGTGHSRYGATGYAHTDCGYVNDIWLSGILGITILYFPIFIMIYKMYKQSDKDLVKLVSIYLVSCFLIFNIKASVIGGNIGALIFFFILFTMNYFCKKDIMKWGEKDD